MFDGGHLADQATVLAGPVTGVYAEVHHRAHPGGLDDDVCAHPGAWQLLAS
jgi:hypothetical protein